MCKLLICLLFSCFLCTIQALSFQPKGNKNKNDNIHSNQDDLTKRLTSRAIDFATKHFSKYTCQVVDHNLHFVVWDTIAYKRPEKEVSKKYKALSESAKKDIYFDCQAIDFTAEHFVAFVVNGPNYMLTVNNRLSDLPGAFVNWPCCQTMEVISSFKNNWAYKNSSIQWHEEGDMDNCVFFGEVSKEIADNKGLQDAIIDSLGQAAFNYIYLNKTNDFLYLSYHYISVNLTYNGNILESGKRDRSLTDFVKDVPKIDFRLLNKFIQNIK